MFRNGKQGCRFMQRGYEGGPEIDVCHHQGLPGTELGPETKRTDGRVAYISLGLENRLLYS